MANYLSPFSSRQFIDSNGDPYSGAKLFTYAVGSSTKVTTYKDEAGSSAHANPIVLNTKGEPADGSGVAYPIWQIGGTAVKFVLAPSGDTDPPVSAIETWDNIDGINDTSVTVDQWISGSTPTYVSATSLTLVGDQTSTYHVGRRIKTTNTAGTIYSTITVSAYTTLTTLTVVNDSGTLDSGLSAISYGVVSAVGTSIPGVTISGNDWTFQGTVHWSKGADVASAAALTLGTDGNYFDVTGTTTITSIATLGIGTIVKLHFDAALTLTHHATDLILKGGANIVTAAGDEAEFIEYSSGDWQMTNFTRASDAEFSIASAATTDLGTTSSENVLITGTTTITGFGTVAAGVVKKIRFSGALTLTYNATSMILPSLVSITTAANDCLEAMSLGSGNWIVTKYTTASGKALADGIVTIASGSLSGTSVTITDIPATYSSIYVHIAGASHNQGGAIDINLQFSTNNGSSYDTGTGNYVGFKVTSATVAATALASAIELTVSGAAIVATASCEISGYQAGPYAQYRSHVNDGVNAYNVSGSYVGSTSSIDALRIILSLGSFDAGTYAVYGIS